MKHEIQKVLVLSTAHISLDTNENIFHEALPVVIYSKEDYGWWVFCGPAYDPEADIPKDLRRLIDLARSLDCVWLCLDSDGPVRDDLPTWDW